MRDSRIEPSGADSVATAHSGPVPAPSRARIRCPYSISVSPLRKTLRTGACSPVGIFRICRSVLAFALPALTVA